MFIFTLKHMIDVVCIYMCTRIQAMCVLVVQRLKCCCCIPLAMSLLALLEVDTEIFCVITCLNFLFAAVQVWFDALNYNVTEGDTVNITLVTDTTDYEFDFSVSLLDTMNGSATGE